MTYDTDPPPEDVNVEWRAEPAELLEVCGDALIAVHLSHKTNVMKGEYFVLQDWARRQLKDAPPLPPESVNALVSQLTAYGFRWEPLARSASLNALAPSATPYDGLGKDSAKIVRDYLAGCLLFSGFAQRLGGEHVLPPEWSRVYAMVALRPTNDAQLAEDALFRRLAEVGNADRLGIGRTVTFDQPTLECSESFARRITRWPSSTTAATQAPAARTPLRRTQLSETKALPEPVGVHTPPCQRLELDDLGREGHARSSRYDEVRPLLWPPQ
jgi:hypothetical protein